MFAPPQFTLFFVVLLFFGICQNAKGQSEVSATLAKANSAIYSDPQRSISLANDVYKKAPKNSDLQLSSLIVLGTAYSENFEIEKSIRSLLAAEKIAELRKDYVNQIRVFSLLGYQYQIMQINDKTHYYLDQAEAIINQHPLPDSLHYLRGNNYSIKALLYQETLDCDYAIEYFNKAITVYRNLKNNDVAKTNLCIGYLNKSLCFIEKNLADSAKISLQESDKIIKQMRLNDDIEISQQIAWAKYHTLNKNYKVSISLLKKNLEKAKKMSQIGLEMEIYHLLSKNYLSIDDIPQYNHYSNLYTETKKQFSEAEKKSITHIINKPLDNSDSEIFNLSKKNLSIILIFLILIISFIFYFTFKSYRLRQKLKKMKSNDNF